MQGFEFTHELAWKVLKDYMEEQGVAGIIGSKNATREAFINGLIDDGEAWMEMIKARNLSKHTYNPETAEEIVEGILTRFYPAFEQLARKFTSLAEQTGNDGFGAVKTTWDHAHRMNKVDPYEFESAEQLLEDFWNEVDKILNEGKRSNHGNKRNESRHHFKRRISSADYCHCQRGICP